MWPISTELIGPLAWFFHFHPTIKKNLAYWTFFEAILSRKVVRSFIQNPLYSKGWLIHAHYKVVNKFRGQLPNQPLRILQFPNIELNCTHAGIWQLFPKSYLQFAEILKGFEDRNTDHYNATSLFSTPFSFFLFHLVPRTRPTTRVQWIFSWTIPELLFLINLDNLSFCLTTLPFLRFSFFIYYWPLSSDRILMPVMGSIL